MPLGPLGVTALLAALDLAAWEWATSTNQSTVGLIAGLLMAPIAIAFVWSLVRVLLAVAQMGLQRAGAEVRSDSQIDAQTDSKTPFDIAAQNERIAA